MSLADKLKDFGEIKESGWKLTSDEPKVAAKTIEPKLHQIYFRRERRKGKIVTLIGEFFLSQSDLDELLKTLKKKLAVGGAVEDNFLMLQTDNEQKIKELIKEQNFGLKKP